MSGKALITGAGQRLGRAMALYLAARGLDVALHYASSADGALEAADAARAQGVRAVTLQADLLDEDATAALVPAAAQALGGPLTVLVNNASIFEYDTIQSATRTSWDRHIGSNLRAPFVLTQAFAAQCPKGARDDAGEPIAQGLIVLPFGQKHQPRQHRTDECLGGGDAFFLARAQGKAMGRNLGHGAVFDIGDGDGQRAALTRGAHHLDPVGAAA